MWRFGLFSMIFRKLTSLERQKKPVAVLTRTDTTDNKNQLPEDFSIISHNVKFRNWCGAANNHWKTASLPSLLPGTWNVLTVKTDRTKLLRAALQNVWLKPCRSWNYDICQPNPSFAGTSENPHSWVRIGNGFQAGRLSGGVCGNCRTLHLPEKWHQPSTRRFQRGKLIYGRNAHKSCYFLMGFGSLFLTLCFEMYPTAYSINEFKHSDFLISRNHSSLRFELFFSAGFFNASVKN